MASLGVLPVTPLMLSVHVSSCNEEGQQVSSEAVPVGQPSQPRLRSVECGTPGNAWRSAESSSGTSGGSSLSRWSGGKITAGLQISTPGQGKGFTFWFYTDINLAVLTLIIKA